VVGVVAWLVLGERPSRSTLLALPVVLLGVVLISGAVGGKPYGADPGLGVILGLCTALCYAGYLLVIRRGGRDARRPAGPVAVATLFTVIASGIVGTLYGDLDLAPAPASLAWLALLGVTSQSAGYLFISISLPRLPAVVTSIILLSQPVMTVVFSIVLLGEAPSAAQFVGVGLVIGGIAAATVPIARIRDAIGAARTVPDDGRMES
jgi:drug/metabolite transporter (DMT)-like permease